jgi:drug/metabolite transporter (DMT)-like permease
LSPRRADLLILLITLIWGTTFAIVHQASAAFPPLALVAGRFFIASIVLLPAAVFRRQLSAQVLRAGGLLGILLFVGFAAQTWGLARTTPSRSGFITCLYVVFVPLLRRLLGERIPARVIAAVAVSVLGLALLAGGCQIPALGCSTFEAALPQRSTGDRWTLVCAFAYAIHVIGVSRWTRGLSILAVNAIQLTVVALLAGLGAALTERPIPTPTASVVIALVFLGLVATVVTFSIMLKAQPQTTPERASLIYSLEAVFAALFSWYWLGEVPSLAVLLGGGLMMSAVVMLEWPSGNALSTA